MIAEVFIAATTFMVGLPVGLLVMACTTRVCIAAYESLDDWLGR